MYKSAETVYDMAADRVALDVNDMVRAICGKEICWVRAYCSNGNRFPLKTHLASPIYLSIIGMTDVDTCFSLAAAESAWINS